MLKAYSHTDFPILESWVTDEALLLQFAGTDFSYPLTAQQIIAYQTIHQDRQFYIGCMEDGTPYAFGEIIPQENGSHRLGRILVGNPSKRGVGLGKLFINELLEEIKQHYPGTLVDLYVWEKNIPAIRCYESVGFIMSPERSMTMVHKELAYHIHKMTYNTAAYAPIIVSNL
ncbi:GNAT family N-acetyltransferase [Pedobacter gandavensis]|uniref:GNAT family N-acetyltransferase n=1 Tax=Pedobacter gandavensis TaxID=2679963 RepID=A0ABR6F3U9_9SPHI|nr:GNAT family N-acetyltransferase [Pedobacter gandavensis]MBB2151694.1 GNAT family N-acetyltransferase [Pedobacter gandavensis]